MTVPSTTPAAPTPSHSLPRLLRSLRSHRRAWIALLAAGLAVALAAQSTKISEPSYAAAERGERNDGRGRGLSDEEGWGEFPPLPPLEDRRRLWPPELDDPICSSKIFVYDLPPSLRLPEETVSQCRWSAYNSELLLHKLLVEPPTASPIPLDHPHYTLFTSNPREADFFFIPLFPACYLFDCWVKAGWTKTERCAVDSSYIQPVMQHIRGAHPFWNASGGADHLLVHPMDYVDGYYTSPSRAAMNASTYLVTVGDVRPAPYGQHFRSAQDIVVPSSTHILNSYYVNPLDWLDGEGHPLAHPRGTQHPDRHVDVLPTYTEIFNSSPNPPLRGVLPPLRAFLRRAVGLSPTPLTRKNRTTLAIFRGGVGTPTDGESYALKIRSLFFPSDGNSSAPPFSSTPHRGFSSLPSFDIALSSPSNQDYATRLSRSRFGLAPPGYTLDTTRLYEYLAFGVVPVFIGTGPRAGQVLPFAKDVDWEGMSVFVPRERAHEVPKILGEIGEEDYERMRRKVWEEGRKVVLEGREGNVWKLIARELCRRKRIGLAPGAEIANN
ncbi:hypothetical protein JCM6882_005747 [Rhodosporidiobolus microsporus]